MECLSCRLLTTSKHVKPGQPLKCVAFTVIAPGFLDVGRILEDPEGMKAMRSLENLLRLAKTRSKCFVIPHCL